MMYGAHEALDTLACLRQAWREAYQMAYGPGGMRDDGTGTQVESLYRRILRTVQIVEGWPLGWVNPTHLRAIAADVQQAIQDADSLIERWRDDPERMGMAVTLRAALAEAINGGKP